MKRIISLLLAVCLIAALVSGCAGRGDGDGGTTAGASSKVSVGICVYDCADSFSHSLSEAAEAYAQQAGFKCDVSDSADDQSAQNSKITALLAEGTGALCVELVDKYAGVGIADMAKVSGVPVVFFNRRPVDDAMSLYDGAYYVGVGNGETGTHLGELMADCWASKRDVIDKNGDGVLQCAVLKCDVDKVDMGTRIDAALKALEAAGVPVEKVRDDSSADTKEKAYDMLNVWFSDGEAPVEAIISAQDDAALGAAEALMDKGYFSGGSYMPIVSAGGTPEAVAAVAEGTLYGTVSLRAEEIVKTAMLLASAAADGTAVETVNEYAVSDRSVWIPSEKIDAENCADHI